MQVRYMNGSPMGSLMIYDSNGTGCMILLQFWNELSAREDPKVGNIP